MPLNQVLSHNPAFDKALIDIECLLAGVKYRAQDFKAAGVAVGDALTLKSEPNNEHDAFAIQVFKSGKFIGYIPRTHNQFVFLAVDRAPERVTCLVTGVWAAGCRLRIVVV